MNDSINQTHWLIIATSTYNNDQMANLKGVHTSVACLLRVLQSFNLRVSIIENPTYSEATNKIKSFCADCAAEEAMPIILYAGHGMRRKNELYFATCESCPEDFSHWINCRHIIDEMEKSSIRAMGLILDCCYSGTIADIINYGPIFKRFFLCSCSPSEESLIIHDGSTDYAAFTWFLSEALSNGAAEFNAMISIDKLKLLIDQQIKRYNEQHTDRKCPFVDFSSTGNLGSESIFPNARHNHRIESKVLVREEELQVLFIKPQILYPVKADGDLGVPMGLWLLKNEIDGTNQDIHVDIFDERLISYETTSPTETEMIALFSQYDVIGISMCTCEVPPALAKFRLIKNKVGKPIVTIAGGIFTYSNEKLLLDTKVIDYIIPGVATYPMTMLLSALKKIKKRGKDEWEKFVQNIGNNDVPNDYIYSQANIDNATCWRAQAMPVIGLNVWDQILNEYANVLNGKADIYTARGCERNCTFCSVQRETQRSRIECLQDKVITEIEYLYEHGIRLFSIKDEDFWAGNKSRVKHILETFKHYPDIKFKIRARVDSTIRSIRPSDLSALNISEIQYGVESPFDDLHKSLLKGLGATQDELLPFFLEHFDAGITVNASFILGLSSEDFAYYKRLESFIQSLTRSEKSNLFKPYFNFFTPHPFKGAIDNSYGSVVTHDLNFYTHKNPVCIPSLPTMNGKTRKAMLKTYDTIVAETKSALYNPPIRNDIKQKFLQGNTISVDTKLVL